MKYLALAILFAVTQANPTTPRKSAGNPTQITAQVKSKGAPSQAQALPSSAPAKTDSTELTKTDSSEQYPKDEQHTVKISKLPPMTVTPLKRDWADWAYWGFNFLLAVVGGFQVYLLWHTLGAVRQQAREMAQQRSLMHLQLVAMQGQVREMQITGKQTDKLMTQVKKSADAATTGANAAESTATFLIESERAWIGVTIAKTSLTRPGAENNGFVWYWPDVKNQGRTPAHIVRIVMRPQQVPMGSDPTEPPLLAEEPEYNSRKV